jgi:hypothetical protein
MARIFMESLQRLNQVEKSLYEVSSDIAELRNEFAAIRQVHNVNERKLKHLDKVMLKNARLMNQNKNITEQMLHFLMILIRDMEQRQVR